MSSVRTPAREEGTARRPRRPRPRASSDHRDEGIVQDDRVHGVLIAAAMVDQADAGGMGAKQAWLNVTILPDGYTVSRGLAKSGNSQPYDENRS